jgi:hypothetical protein
VDGLVTRTGFGMKCSTRGSGLPWEVWSRWSSAGVGRWMFKFRSYGVVFSDCVTARGGQHEVATLCAGCLEYWDARDAQCCVILAGPLSHPDRWGFAPAMVPVGLLSASLVGSVPTGSSRPKADSQPGSRADRRCRSTRVGRWCGVGRGNEGHLVNALASRGDEGRGTLR